MFHFVPRCIGIAMTYYLSVAWSDGMCDIDMSNTPFPISLTFGRHGVTKRTLVGCKYRHALRAKHFGSRAFWRGRPRAVLSFVFYAIWEAYMMLKAPTHVPAKFHIDTWNAPSAPPVRRRGRRDPKWLQVNDIGFRPRVNDIGGMVYYHMWINWVILHINALTYEQTKSDKFSTRDSIKLV